MDATLFGISRVFNNFLLTDGTDRSKIRSDPHVFDSTLAYTPFLANILFKKKKKKRPLQTRESNYRIETIEIITNLNLEMRKRFQCEKCKEKFINNSNLKVHMKVKFKSNINKQIFPFKS